MQSLQCAIALHLLSVTSKQKHKMTKQNNTIRDGLTIRTARVNINKIDTDYERFQPRSRKVLNSHVGALCEVLERGKELDPVAVWQENESSLWVVDGHHRLAAYEHYLKKVPARKRKVAKAGKISVVVLRGPLDRVRLHASTENSKNRLNLTREEKSQAAWDIIRESASVALAEVSATGLVSSRTAQTMRNVLNWLKQEYGDEEFCDLPSDWAKARASYNLRNNDAEAQRNDEAERRAVLRERLRKHIGYPIENVPPSDVDLVMEVIAEALGDEKFKSTYAVWLRTHGGYFEDFSLEEDEDDWDDRQLELPFGSSMYGAPHNEEDDAPF